MTHHFLTVALAITAGARIKPGDLVVIGRSIIDPPSSTSRKVAR